MLQLLDKYAHLFKSWNVASFEQEGEAYVLQVSASLVDASRLDLRDYVFADGTGKYSYQWKEPDGTLRRRWDNAPYWPCAATAPDHAHLGGHSVPESSTITNLEDLLLFVADYLGQHSAHALHPRQ